MSDISAKDLQSKKCKPCEGGVPPLVAQQIDELMPAIPEWFVTPDGKRIQRKWRVKDFDAALAFFNKIAEVANADDHHPDLHLTGYRDVRIELWTHAIGGLSENDFILAAKIDAIPVPLKS